MLSPRLFQREDQFQNEVILHHSEAWVLSLGMMVEVWLFFLPWSSRPEPP